ncbi:NUDIX hydrolase [Legionella sp. W05-934-2]|jgi:ADP-ribose pyrophosphatase YjhB (NUDIX family)|uniref:NUDIX hydrolase n=1 Tax=Legionella sp. W05-934-2 TaxID=1198649 RepID=UPI003462AE27
MVKTIQEQSLWLRWATEIQAIAQTGLSYTKDVYDWERYEKLVAISAQMMAELTDADKSALYKAFLQQKGYACPKLDVRAFIVKEDSICLVQEAQDSKWSLPGGWADVNQTPSQCVIREVLEETGFRVEADYLMAYWDTAHHDHPPHWPYIYKAIFACELKGGTRKFSHEIEDIKFFPIDKLPTLSQYRITEKQIQQLYTLYKQGNKVTVFD